MRDDGLWLDADDVEFYAGVLTVLDTLLKRLGYNGSDQTRVVRSRLEAFLNGRADGHAAVTTRPPLAEVPDADHMDANEAAGQLGVTAGAVRKACRTGRFQGVARKQRGRWMIPADELTGSA